MEVHHHSAPAPAGVHSGRKKFTHYLWEFLMLFLAVFCGFLAENQREHLVEHQREKKFMISLVEDLETDTTELKRAIGKADSTGRYSDSIIIFLLNYTISNEIPSKISRLITIGGQHLYLINTDRTSSQLKNSGAMRLIRNKEVSTAILQYWKQIDETNLSLDRYVPYRNAGRELLFKLYMIPQVYQRGFLMNLDSVKHFRVIDTDPKKWGELINLLTIGGSVARGPFKNNLEKQFELAKDLIRLIRKEYRLFNKIPAPK